MGAGPWVSPQQWNGKFTRGFREVHRYAHLSTLINFKPVYKGGELPTNSETGINPRVWEGSSNIDQQWNGKRGGREASVLTNSETGVWEAYTPGYT